MSAEEYQRRAKLAQQQADSARQEEDRKAFLEIAALWRALADRAVKSAKKPDSP
jgi:hypothetical protein